VLELIFLVQVGRHPIGWPHTTVNNWFLMHGPIHAQHQVQTPQVNKYTRTHYVTGSLVGTAAALASGNTAPAKELPAPAALSNR
jgi:hypothetical protein